MIGFREYAGKGKAVFIEGGTLKTVNDTINDIINWYDKRAANKAITLFWEYQSLKINELNKELKVLQSTVKQDLKKFGN